MNHLQINKILGVVKIKAKESIVQKVLLYLGIFAISITLWEILKLVIKIDFVAQEKLKLVLFSIIVTLVIVNTIIGVLRVIRSEKK